MGPFYRLYLATRHRQGVMPAPRAFFRAPERAVAEGYGALLYLRPNDVIAASLELARQRGLRWLDWGRTDTHHHGLREFKVRRGMREDPLA